MVFGIAGTNWQIQGERYSVYGDCNLLLWSLYADSPAIPNSVGK